MRNGIDQGEDRIFGRFPLGLPKLRYGAPRSNFGVFTWRPTPPPFGTAVERFHCTASLISLLALQTHQESEARAGAHPSRTGPGASRHALGGPMPTLQQRLIAIPRGTPTPQRSPETPISFIYGAMIYGWQDTYSQYRSGLLDEDFFRQMRTGAVQALSNPTSRAVWETYRVPGTQFTAFMDGLAASLSAAEP